MPCIVQPGGGSGKMRMRYTARRKRGLVAASKRLQMEGRSVHGAAAELFVSPTNLSKWASQGMGEIDSLDKILKSKKKAVLTGPASQLKPIKDALLHYIFELRKQGVMIDMFTIVLRASWISPKFRAKSFAARCSCMKRFLHAHLYTY
jgi:hypothetical protein